jgi:hypothetical protein
VRERERERERERRRRLEQVKGELQGYSFLT